MLAEGFTSFRGFRTAAATTMALVAGQHFNLGGTTTLGSANFSALIIDELCQFHFLNNGGFK